MATVQSVMRGVLSDTELKQEAEAVREWAAYKERMVRQVVNAAHAKRAHRASLTGLSPHPSFDRTASAVRVMEPAPLQPATASMVGLFVRGGAGGSPTLNASWQDAAQGGSSVALSPRAPAPRRRSAAFVEVGDSSPRVARRRLSTSMGDGAASPRPSADDDNPSKKLPRSFSLVTTAATATHAASTSPWRKPDAPEDLGLRMPASYTQLRSISVLPVQGGDGQHPLPPSPSGRSAIRGRTLTMASSCASTPEDAQQVDGGLGNRRDSVTDFDATDVATATNVSAPHLPIHGSVMMESKMQLPAQGGASTMQSSVSTLHTVPSEDFIARLMTSAAAARGEVPQPSHEARGWRAAGGRAGAVPPLPRLQPLEEAPSRATSNSPDSSIAARAHRSQSVPVRRPPGVRLLPLAHEPRQEADRHVEAGEAHSSARATSVPPLALAPMRPP
ncbi:MAG: hypothetical protein EOO41_04080, partial [Methanobacteriota archaeon]